MAAAIHFDQIRLPPELRGAARRGARVLAPGNRGGRLRSARRLDLRRLQPGIQPQGRRARLDRHDLAEALRRPERSFLERYVVTEEFRVANAPVGLHFTADRQSGPILLKYANESIKSDILPRIARGECCFCIGMSEPGSGSDLFAAKTSGRGAQGGWRVNGTKVWTTGAHHADYMIGLFRTSPRPRTTAATA